MTDKSDKLREVNRLFVDFMKNKGKGSASTKWVDYLRTNFDRDELEVKIVGKSIFLALKPLPIKQTFVVDSEGVTTAGDGADRNKGTKIVAP